MKKYLLIYSLILVAVYVLLSALGRDSNYIIERKIWKIYQEQKDIARDPAVIPDNVFERVIHEYKQIIEKYSYSSHAPDLYIRLGEVHAHRRRRAGLPRKRLRPPRSHPPLGELGRLQGRRAG